MLEALDPAIGAPLRPQYVTYRQLRAAGLSRRDVDASLTARRLVRVRKGRFVLTGIMPEFIAAAEVGGRLDCVSLLRLLGVFVRERGPLHVEASRDASRLPSRPKGMICHWRDTSAGREDLAADLIEALAQACLCQRPRDSIATLDSAWHRGLVDADGIAEVFGRLPTRMEALRPLLDPRSEAGTETLVRLAVRSLGHSTRLQVRIEGVGRVDLLVDGWLIIECDSEAHRSGWAAQKRDRRRDAEAARLGYATLRLIAEDILYRPEWVLETLRLVLAGRGT